MMIAQGIVFQFPDHFLIKFNMQLCAAGILFINAVHNLAMGIKNLMKLSTQEIQDALKLTHRKNRFRKASVEEQKPAIVEMDNLLNFSPNAIIV